MTNESTEDRAVAPDRRQPERHEGVVQPELQTLPVPGGTSAARTAVERARERILARARRVGVR